MHVFHKLSPTQEQILHCQFSFWYPLFKKHTPKATVIKPLPQSFIDYLGSDGIDLPEDGHYQVNMGTGDGEYSDWSEEEDEDDTSDEEEEEEEEEAHTHKKTPTEIFSQFQDIHEQVKSTIKDYGAVTPKLNWSAPRDATWIMATNTMKCQNASDVYLLLNASNYITHDLTSAFDEVEDLDQDTVEFELVLRKWFEINPALEFRVFIKQGQIIGITQRDLNYYDYLQALKPTITSLIETFFEDAIAETFPDDDFVMDVYLPRPFDKVFLIDINPFARKTDSQLFTWHELCEHDPSNDYELRLITEVDKGRFAVKDHSENMVPKDVVDASLDSKAMAELAQQWKELQMKSTDV